MKLSTIEAFRDCCQEITRAADVGELADYTAETAGALTLAMEDLAGMLTALDNLPDSDYVHSLINDLPNDTLAEVLLQTPVFVNDEKLNKALALDVAEVLGPDHAQNWYKFIVLVTKLA